MNTPRPVKRRPVVRIFWSSSRPKRHKKRLAYALAFSLSVHILFLSLQFGAAGLGLPGLTLPWDERRLEASELTVRLVQAPQPPPPAPAAEPVKLRLAPELALKPAEAPAATRPARTDGAFEAALAQPKPPPPPAEPERVVQAPAPAAKSRARERKVKAKPQPRVLAQAKPQEDTFKVPPPRRAEPEARAPETVAKKQKQTPPAAVQAKEDALRKQAEDAARAKAEEAARIKAEEAARIAAEEAARRRAEDYAQQLARTLQQEFEAAREEEARQIEEIVRKQEDERRLALELEARRLAEKATKEAAELEGKRALALKKEQEAKALEDSLRIAEAAKKEAAKKEEEAKRLALEAEALKLAEEAARQQAIAREKERLAKRQAEQALARAKEAADRKGAEAAAQRERDRLASLPGAGPGSSPSALSGKELAAKALEQLRTPGAARDDLLKSPGPPPRPDNPRRRSIFGVERDVGLRMYVESWRTKLERHGALNYRHWVSRIARDNPVVTVSIRSDGSIEDVVIHRSSGVRELDEAVRRIAYLHAPYSAFPPALATRYDVIEIRRVWFFDTTLKIMDEM